MNSSSTKLESLRLNFPESDEHQTSSNQIPRQEKQRTQKTQTRKQRLEQNLRLKLHCRCHHPLEPSPSLPRFSLSWTVWVREIWVYGVCLLHSFCLGLIFLVCSFFVVCCFFVFLVWVSSSCFFLFVFLLHLVWVSRFLHSGLFFFFSSSCSLGFFGFVWSLYGTQVYNARFPRIQLEFNVLDLAQQNRVYWT